MLHLLYVNACVRTESRTKRLADCLLRRISEQLEPQGGVRVHTLNLMEEERGLMPLRESDLRRRERALSNGNFDDPLFYYAKTFAEEDLIVIAAPYWDLSFPAVLKDYLEHVCINGLTFQYDRNGNPQGLCRARRLYYVTTAGGEIGRFNLGYDYVKTLSVALLGIRDCQCIRAVGLDMVGNEPESILRSAETGISRMEIML